MAINNREHWIAHHLKAKEAELKLLEDPAARLPKKKRGNMEVDDAV